MSKRNISKLIVCLIAVGLLLSLTVSEKADAGKAFYICDCFGASMENDNLYTALKSVLDIKKQTAL